MILAAGLTPAWQRIMAFDAFRVGEVNRAAETHACASGKVLNVGLALARLGAPSLTLAPLGGDAFEWVEREFSELGARRRWIRTASPTRTCTTILDRSSGRTTELVENAAPLSDEELSEFALAFRELGGQAKIVTLSGSAPAGAPADYYRDLLRSLPRNSEKPRAIVDARGAELIAALDAQPFLVKPNYDELASTLGRTFLDEIEMLAAMRELHRRGAEWVVVTRGAGRVWATRGIEWIRFDPPPIDRVMNPIGCGDCLAAGLAWRLLAGDDVPRAIEFGLAAAAQNAAELLPARLDPDRLQPPRSDATN